MGCEGRAAHSADPPIPALTRAAGTQGVNDESKQGLNIEHTAGL